MRPAAKAGAQATPPPKASRRCRAEPRRSDWALKTQQQDHDDGVETAGSLRRCVVTRAERAPDDLLRFVVDPSGAIVPDLARKLPGRGVWVTADKASVAAAVKANAFAKSLKRQVTVAPDLPDRVESLFVKRALEALSLANKAGLVVDRLRQGRDAPRCRARGGAVARRRRGRGRHAQARSEIRGHSTG